MHNSQDLQKVTELRETLTKGSESRIAEQREAGKLTAAERIGKIVDAGSFVELYAMLNDGSRPAGVITGYATVDARPVYLFAQDYTVHGGAMGKLQAAKVTKMLDLAVKTGAPVIAVMDSAGVCIDEGAEAMNAYGEIYQKMARMSGVCPIISVMAGPCIGGAALISQLADINIAVKGISRLMVFGPQVMAAMNGLAVDAEAIGGADKAAASGAAALVASGEDEAYAMVRKVFGMLPSSNLEDADFVETDDMSRLLPAMDPDDADALVKALADSADACELYAAYEPAIRTYLTRMGGHSVAVISACGKLTAGAMQKAARFVRFADCYSLPVISLLNTEGVVIESIGQQSWLMKAQSQLLYAYAEATAPKLAVVTGNAIGQAYVAMGAKANADVAYAWPSAVISALQPEAAVAIMYADEVKADTALTVDAARAKYAQKYVDEVASAVKAAGAGLVDDVIDPAKTRAMLISAIEMLLSKRDSTPSKKHGNLPM